MQTKMRIMLDHLRLIIHMTVHFWIIEDQQEVHDYTATYKHHSTVLLTLDFEGGHIYY